MHDANVRVVAEENELKKKQKNNNKQTQSVRARFIITAAVAPYIRSITHLYDSLRCKQVVGSIFV